MEKLSDKSGGGSTFVFPVRRENGLPLVIPGKFVNSTLDQDKSVFGIFVLSVLLQMFPDSYCLLDQMVQIFWDLASQTFSSQNSENLGSRQVSDLKMC